MTESVPLLRPPCIRIDNMRRTGGSAGGSRCEWNSPDPHLVIRYVCHQCCNIDATEAAPWEIWPVLSHREMNLPSPPIRALICCVPELEKYQCGYFMLNVVETSWGYGCSSLSWKRTSQALPQGLSFVFLAVHNAQ
jgi:hypothetical protein